MDLNENIKNLVGSTSTGDFVDVLVSALNEDLATEEMPDTATVSFFNTGLTLENLKQILTNEKDIKDTISFIKEQFTKYTTDCTKVKFLGDYRNFDGRRDPGSPFVPSLVLAAAVVK